MARLPIFMVFYACRAHVDPNCLADVIDLFPGPRTANAAYDVAGDARRLGLKLKK